MTNYRTYALGTAGVTLAMAALAALSTPSEAWARSEAFETPSIQAGATQAPAVEQDATDSSLPALDTAPAVQAPAIDDANDPDIICMAKVVHHEAANQPRIGQLAVAQLIRHRTRVAGFAGSACGVANQRGQFFNTGAYRPAKDARWQVALAVAREAMRDDAAQVVPGALFFCAKRATASAFMRSRQQLAVVGGHVFYR